MNSKLIGEFIHQLRLEKGLSQNQLADLIPISRQAISKWERYITIPDSSTLLRLSEIFEVNINELLTGKRAENPSIEELENVALNILDERNKKSKQNKQILITSACIIIALIIGFLLYYFVNSYNSIKVYKISGESENFYTHNGLLITAREKTYLKLGEISPVGNENNNIKYLKVIYKEGNKKHLLYESTDEDIMMISLDGYEDDFSKNNINNILKNSDLIITYNNNEEDIIKLSFKKDFTNDKYFFLSQHEEIENNKTKKEKTISSIDKKVIDKIKEKGTKTESGYSLDITEKETHKSLVYRKGNIEEVLMMISQDQTIWIYNLSRDESICFVTNDLEKNCKKNITKDLEKYLLK